MAGKKFKAALAQELTSRGAGENLRVNIPRPDNDSVVENKDTIEMSISELNFDEAFKSWNTVLYFSDMCESCFQKNQLLASRFLTISHSFDHDLCH